MNGPLVASSRWCRFPPSHDCLERPSASLLRSLRYFPHLRVGYSRASFRWGNTIFQYFSFSLVTDPWSKKRKIPHWICSSKTLYAFIHRCTDSSQRLRSFGWGRGRDSSARARSRSLPTHPGKNHQFQQQQIESAVLPRNSGVGEVWVQTRQSAEGYSDDCSAYKTHHE